MSLNIEQKPATIRFGPEVAGFCSRRAKVTPGIFKPVLKNENDVTTRSVMRFMAFYENYPRIGEILNQLRAGVAINDQWAKEKLKNVYSELTEGAREGIRRSIELGHIRNIDPELLAFFLLTWLPALPAGRRLSISSCTGQGS
jgi:hypothetical protein